MRLYDSAVSGNCYKVRLLAAQTGRKLERVPVDLLTGEARTAQFKAKVPLGRVPALELGDGTVLGESNAILWFLAEDTAFMPATPLGRAQTLQWLFWEQYDHEPYLAVLRAWKALFGVPKGREGEVGWRTERGVSALGVMERHLGSTPFFVDGRYGLADLALYAYTHVCPEGGFDLAPFPRVRAWLDRVAAQPGHITMDA